MKEIPLTQGKFAIVDDEDYEYLNQWKWHADFSKGLWYAKRNGTVSEKRANIKMHRVIMNTPNGLEVDHIDGNGLNNQKSNLRNCTTSQNSKNKKLYVNNKCRFVGVSPSGNKKKNPFRATIWVNGKQKYLGSFQKQEEAAKAYNDAANIYFGEFARLNPMKE